MAEKDNYARARLLQREITRKNVSHYRGQLFRLNFQRLVSPAFPTFPSTILEMQKISSFAHIEVNWKFSSHHGVGQVFNVLDSSLPGKITNNNKAEHPMGV